MTTKGKIVDVYAEWDDRAGAFRIYLAREEPEVAEGFPDPEPLPSFGRCERDSIEWRLHLAAWIGAAKAMSKADSGAGEPLGWSGEVKDAQKAAEKVAKIIKAELARVKQGKPAPTPEAVQVARIMAGVGR